MKFKRANVNIALLKYWGKSDQELKLPQQTSISVTAEAFYTRTNVTLDPTLTKDKVFLDDKELTSLQYNRVIQHLNALRQRFNRKEHCVVTSFNTVYIRAGFASSASAFAALTAAYIAAINEEVSPKEMSRLARLGSGSATRSIHGGFVIWRKGFDHESSYAEKLDIDWPEFRLIFTVIDPSVKAISSQVGMQLSVEKARSFPSYINKCSSLVAPMIDALEKKDLHAIGKISEQSAELMRNVMLEAGVDYHSPKTQVMINRIHTLQDKYHLPVYYTFDAGPNLILLTTEEYVDQILPHLSDVETIVSKVGGGISDEDI